MIIYQKTKDEFLNDVLDGCIDTQILTSVVREVGHSVGRSEQSSWRESLNYMRNVLSDNEIPRDAGVAIEYHIPQTTKRIDFILTGKNDSMVSSAIVVELKQWSEGISKTEKDGVVKTAFYGEVSHPSYQAWSYVTLLEDYNTGIQDTKAILKPCAYLHNYQQDGVLDDPFYKRYIELAPVFFKSDAKLLRSFIKKYVHYGDKGELLYTVEKGEIRPSKSLADSLLSMLRGNREFILIDDQKVVFETALTEVVNANKGKKSVVIVEGGPGTGKSVVAINLLSELTSRGKNVRYVTRNSAPRKVYQYMLTGTFTQQRITNLFSSSGSFVDATKDIFDGLIVDEAHRLNEKSGMFSNLGENQIKEIIQASKSSIFFVDDDQRVTLKDIGNKNSIMLWAKSLGAKVTVMSLASQFRCNGSDGYLAWLDNILQIKQTANETLDDINYDFQVYDNPNGLHKMIMDKNRSNNKSRLVAGYCWKWVSKKDPRIKDIVIGDYEATWNLDKHGQAWIVHPDSVSEVGCIHTCQGLELDYVGVIIGPDLIVRNGKVVTDASKRASTDQSLKGLKAILKNNPDKAMLIADSIIKNTYRTLMTRGMKGCYVYSTDPETQEYFKNKLSNNNQEDAQYSNIPTGESINID
ncbi:MAG: hypothetical protein UX84_C0026G0002 [Microgenomates group bacterium GW2011_GWD1_47_13]|nr:MAG: hypothetical protein US97_C0024G0005 [Microgenomates group bacterium GW2011_GWF1_38_5]KKU27379.1 MAG: hypothetical protein UX40_C0019G0009 [Microgenomates group bacterium GW2011_GWF2_46_18]KKU60460.1 MAG: hypothetical protein UX84_C0026G0002 [Microgenomates group bacterium GW2011_GWD1_47_13]OGD70323.1 MAG: hypothetical protein A2187_01265 [Candidatus Collierbacteria bacterium RIFOXYA1_FULL_46_24]HBD02582.1 hypothetical protein [Candidatus Collierbacteria bacterium]